MTYFLVLLLDLCFHFFHFSLWSAGMAKFTFRPVLFFFFFFFFGLIRSLVVWPWLGDLFYISKSMRNLCISFSRTDSWWCIYHLFLRSNLNFLQNSMQITSPPSCVPSYILFYTNLRHSLIMRLIVLFMNFRRISNFSMRWKTIININRAFQISVGWSFFTGV